LKNIGTEISRSIRESKWMKLVVMKGAKKRHYWACVMGIDVDSKKLVITAYNHTMTDNPVKGIISTAVEFDNIESALVIDHTSYDRPIELIPFIERNIDRLDWLEYSLHDDRLLNYYRTCLRYDTDPYCKSFTMVDGINEKSFPSVGELTLNLQQQGQLVGKLERISKKAIQAKRETIDFALNILSIKTLKGLFVIAYRVVTFNPKKGSLIADSSIVYNQTFLSDEKKTSKHSLYSYFDRDCNDFSDRFEKNPKEVKDELMNVLRPGELLDDSPHLIDIVRKIPWWIEREFDYLADLRKQDKLSTPLRAFFGEMSNELSVSKKPQDELIIMDFPLNPDQIRSIHSGLNHPVTYVQGPPGTGKTTAIHSLIVSAFFNERSILVSSNNNKPIDDLYENLKFMRKDNYDIYMPIIRLGNDMAVLDSIDYIKTVLDKARIQDSFQSALDIFKAKNKKRFKAFNEILARYEERELIKEKLDVIKKMVSQFGGELRAASMLQNQINEYERRYTELLAIDDSEVRKNLINADRSFYSWLYYTSIKHFRKLLDDDFRELHDILHNEANGEKIKQFNKYIANGNNLRKLLEVFPIVLTTNQSAYRLGEPDRYFDLVVMDEAGQCSIGYSLVPILRGSQLILVGDEKQLRPVLSLSREANNVFMRRYQIPSLYNYNNSSILMVMKEVDQFSKKILLREHYRCKHNIIDFCNQKYYHNELVIHDSSTDQAVFEVPINQDNEQKPVVKNTSIKEIETIIDLIKQNENSSCGVVSPFHNQAQLIKDELDRVGLSNIPSGTVHLFQGDEKDYIYCSLAITKYSSNRTYGWLKNNEELINVAMTRARKAFYLIADVDDIKRRSTEEPSDMDDLIRHIESKGEAIIQPADELEQKRIRQYLSEREKELFETLRHLFSMTNRYYVEKQVKVSAILGKFTDDDLFDFGTKSVFDFVVYSKGLVDHLELIIELDGPEHEEDQIVMANDLKKQQICDDNGIKLIRIKNPFVRRYQFIREELSSLLTKI